MVFLLSILINANAHIVVDEEEDFFSALERTLVDGGYVNVGQDQRLFEDLIEEAKEEELKDSKDEEKELAWDYSLVEELLP